MKIKKYILDKYGTIICRNPLVRGFINALAHGISDDWNDLQKTIQKSLGYITEGLCQSLRVHLEQVLVSQYEPTIINQLLLIECQLVLLLGEIAYKQSGDMENNPQNRSLAKDSEDDHHLVLNENKKKETSEQEDTFETIDDVLLKEQPTKSVIKEYNLKEINTIGREQSILQYYKLLINENCDKLNINKLTSNDVIQTTNLLIEPGGQMISHSYKPEKLMTNNVNELIRELNKSKELSSKSYELLCNLRQCEKTMNEITNLLDLYSLQESFKYLKLNFSKEYEEHHLYDDVVSVLYPYLKQYLSSNWNIFNDNHNQELIDLFLKWRIILQYVTIGLIIDDDSASKANMNLYDYLIWSTWMPVIQETIQQWNLCESDSLINFLKQWQACVPEYLLDYIRDQLILPKLLIEVELLDSKCDSTAVHSDIRCVKFRTLKYLESLGNRINHYLVDDTLNYLIKEAATLDNDNHITFNAPVYELEPIIHLDIFLPRIVDLSLHSSDCQHQNSTYLKNAASIIKRILSISLHPNSSKRLGSTEWEALVDVYTLQLLYVFGESLAIPKGDDPSLSSFMINFSYMVEAFFIGTQQQAIRALSHIERIIIKEKSYLFVQATPKQHRPP
ncbi:unnamed protein product [Rotaria sordida]|uniref:Uncharacterized protein n=1 Tax=Rotaria sordida TaxID=392033 RepID=A0A814ZMY4_9BILA|nr:unnamed protein product [Rotaria sordida]